MGAAPGGVEPIRSRYSFLTVTGTQLAAIVDVMVMMVMLGIVVMVVMVVMVVVKILMQSGSRFQCDGW